MQAAVFQTRKEDQQKAQLSLHDAKEILAGANLGCVAYLNSQPLIYGAEDCFALEHPAELSRGLMEGRLSGGLLPLYDVVTMADGMRPHTVEGPAIVSRGPVHSVYVVSRQPIGQLDRIYLTTASRSSVNLLRRLLQEIKGGRGAGLPELVRRDPPGTGDLIALIEPMERDRAGWLVIGNEALVLRHQLEKRGVAGEFGLRFFDLGEAWTERTGLPMVYAVWALSMEIPVGERQEIGAALRTVAEHGLRHRKEIARDQWIVPTALAEKYLMHHIQYDISRESLGEVIAALDFSSETSGI